MNFFDLDPIVYYGGCWAPNIGNAFIDYGAQHTLRGRYLYMFSEYNSILFGRYRENSLNLFYDLKPKCVVFSGMVTCRQFIYDQKEIIDICDKEKIPIVFNGVGGEDYSREEVRAFREFIKCHNIAGFISRDDKSYDAYCDLFKHAYRGIDVGFFLSDIPKYKVMLGLDKKYVVVNEDDLGFNVNIQNYGEYQEAERDGSLVFSHHQLTSMKEKNQVKKRTMMAEFPDEYICLYAQTKTLFATRVHACVATLSFGGRCFQPYSTPRSSIFERIGCGGITKGFVSANMDYLDGLKSEHEKSLSKIMEDVL